MQHGLTMVGLVGRDLAKRFLVHKQKDIRGQLGQLGQIFAAAVPVRSAANAPSEPAGP